MIHNDPKLVKSDTQNNVQNKDEGCLGSLKKLAKIITLVVLSLFLVSFFFQSFRDQWSSVLGLNKKTLQVQSSSSSYSSTPNVNVINNEPKENVKPILKNGPVEGSGGKVVHFQSNVGVKSNAKWDNSTLKGIWEETKGVLLNGKYVVNGKTIPLPRKGYKTWQTVDKGGINKLYYYKAPIAKLPVPKFEKTQITVENLDTLDAAQREIKLGRNPAVLNFANGRKETPGGGFESGANAQEEDLCRRSELGQMMFSQKHNNKAPSHYPLDDKLIYTPDLTVFRKGRAENYAFLEEPFKVSFLTSAAPYLKEGQGIKIGTDGKVDYSDPLVRFNVSKMAISQLLAAYENGHDSVILGAFGCGAFHNPPDAVAQIYKDVINGYFKGAFKSIVFAVLDDQHSQGTKAHSPKGNYKAFKDCFEGPQANQLPETKVGSYGKQFLNATPKEQSQWKWMPSLFGNGK